MQLRLDAADRLVELVEERRGPVPVDEAARRLFALRHAPVGLARSDLSFLDRETERLVGARLAGPVVDTVGLARRLLAGRGTRFGLAALAHFFGTAVAPCHRALPDAQATAEILVGLLGLAQERG